MAPRSSKFLIDPEAHLVLQPSDYDDPSAPWELLFANGPVHSTEPEHQAVCIALSPSDNTTGDPAGDHDLGVEYLRWVADNLAGALGVNLILPHIGDYIMPNGSMTMMTEEMKNRYGYMLLPYGTKIHRDIEEYFLTQGEREAKDEAKDEAEALAEGTLLFEDLYPDREHDDSPYNIHHNHDTPDKD